MEQAMTELPLAIFTTLAPIGAGAFIVLAIAFFTTKFSDDQLKKIDRLSFLPLAVVAVGFLASFAHLTAPMNATNVFAGIGSSPLSNEILVGGLFLVLTLVYCILAVMGKLSEGARKGFSAVVALLALVFAVLTGLAYMMDTVASWNTPSTPLAIVGFCLLGGSLFGTCLLALANSLEVARKSSFRTTLLAVSVIGVVVAVGATIAQVAMVSSLTNPMVEGAALVNEITVFLVVFVAGILIALVCELWLLAKSTAVPIAVIATVLVVVAVFMARIAFYAMYLSVGL